MSQKPNGTVEWILNAVHQLQTEFNENFHDSKVTKCLGGTAQFTPQRSDRTAAESCHTKEGTGYPDHRNTLIQPGGARRRGPVLGGLRGHPTSWKGPVSTTGAQRKKRGAPTTTKLRTAAPALFWLDGTKTIVYLPRGRGKTGKETSQSGCLIQGHTAGSLRSAQDLRTSGRMSSWDSKKPKHNVNKGGYVQFFFMLTACPISSRHSADCKGSSRN